MSGEGVAESNLCEKQSHAGNLAPCRSFFAEREVDAFQLLIIAWRQLLGNWRSKTNMTRKCPKKGKVFFIQLPKNV